MTQPYYRDDTVTLLLGGSTAFYTSRLAAERDRAQREAAKATKASDVMIGLLTSVDPIASRATGEGLTVRGLLDAGTEHVQTELAGQPELQSEILTVLGRIYRRLGVYDKSQRLLDRFQGLLRSPQVRQGRAQIVVSTATLWVSLNCPTQKINRVP